ncbi:MAG: hypothetical protein ACI8S6_001682 [Myxococcota bacterium]|jgi:hypothetical protein
MKTMKQIGFALLACGLGLVGVELLSAGLERTVLPLQPHLPSPSPVSGAPSLALEEHEAISAETAARWGGVEGERRDRELLVPGEAHIVLDEDSKHGWRLPRGREAVVEGVRYRINREGMRGAPLSRKAPGEVRLLTLGDSSIYGDLVAEEAIFSRVAAGHLSAAWGCEVRDYNGAVPGYSADQAVSWLQELGPRIQPEYIVMGAMWSDIYTGNESVEDLGYLRSPLRMLATYRVLRTMLSPWLSARRVRWIGSRDDFTDPTEARLGAYISSLRQTVDVARGLGAEVIFLMLPAPIDLDVAPVPESVQEHRAAMALVAEETGSLLVHGPAWMAAEGGSLSLFDDQVHPSALGHGLLGYALSETVQQRPPPAGCLSDGG